MKLIRLILRLLFLSPVCLLIAFYALILNDKETVKDILKTLIYDSE